MSWNSPAQWLLLHPMCAVQSYCLWQGYYPRRVMVIDTMSCCLPATCSAFFLTDSCMLEIQLFWVNSSCQETKHQLSNFAKAFSCFCVLVCFVLFLLEGPSGDCKEMIWDLNGQHKLYWPAAAFAGCPVIREAGRRWTARGSAGGVLGDEQDSKDAGETQQKGWCVRERFFLGGGDPAWSNDLGHVWGLAERNSGRAWKKGGWIRNGGRHEPDPDSRAALVTAVIENTCPGPDRTQSVGCGCIRWAMKKERWRSNKKIRNTTLQPIYLREDESHHNLLLTTMSLSTGLYEEFGTSKIQQFLFISSAAMKIPSSMFSKQAKTEVSKPLASRHGGTGTLTPSMPLLIYPSPFSNVEAASGDLWHLRFVEAVVIGEIILLTNWQQHFNLLKILIHFQGTQGWHATESVLSDSQVVFLPRCVVWTAANIELFRWLKGILTRQHHIDTFMLVK